MKASDFDRLGIRHFTADEVTATGARLEDVQDVTIDALDRFREAIQMPLCILSNGLTTGAHKSRWHAMGYAVDVRFYSEPVYIEACVYHAIAAGFVGIGTYYNGTAYSMHLDMRVEPALWCGRKPAPGGGQWRYSPMIVDPRALAP